MKKRKHISLDDAKRIGESLYIDWDQVDLDQFRQGLIGNHKQGTTGLEPGPTYDGVLLTGRLVMAHMQEFPDYFTRLEKLKAEVDEFQARRK